MSSFKLIVELLSSSVEAVSRPDACRGCVEAVSRLCRGCVECRGLPLDVGKGWSHNVVSRLCRGCVEVYVEVCVEADVEASRPGL